MILLEDDARLEWLKRSFLQSHPQSFILRKKKQLPLYSYMIQKFVEALFDSNFLFSIGGPRGLFRIAALKPGPQLHFKLKV